MDDIFEFKGKIYSRKRLKGFDYRIEALKIKHPKQPSPFPDRLMKLNKTKLREMIMELEAELYELNNK